MIAWGRSRLWLRPWWPPSCRLPQMRRPEADPFPRASHELHTEMEQEDRIARLRERVREEVLEARRRDDQWLLVHLSVNAGGGVLLGVDSIFRGFRDSRELRGPRWRTLQSAQEFLGSGFSLMIAGELTAYLVFQRLIAGNVPPGLIMHVDAVHRWAPRCAHIVPTVNSIHGFLSPELPKNRSLGARRPGRTTRARLTAGGCRLCGSTADTTLHHLIPRAAGGATEDMNLLSVCRLCHDGIHDGTVDVKDLVLQVSLERIRQMQRATEAGSSRNDAA